MASKSKSGKSRAISSAVRRARKGGARSTASSPPTKPVIVLVHWRIKPEKVQDFFDHWTTEANIKKDHRSGLIGEFLSKPMRLEELSETKEKFRFRICDLSPTSCEAPYVSFLNVGLWKDWETFYAGVGKDLNDDLPIMEFEQYRRVRTILKPYRRRIGDYPMPEKDHLS